MVKRYFQLKESIDEVSVNSDDLYLYLLTPKEHAALKSLFEHLANFQSITLALQKEDITLGKMRVLFDGVIEMYPTMTEYLSVSAPIIEFKDFEVVFHLFIFFHFLHFLIINQLIRITKVIPRPGRRTNCRRRKSNDTALDSSY